MSSHGNKRQRRHPLNRVKSKETDIKSILPAIRRGEREAIDEAIIFFIRKALAIANNYRRYGNMETFQEFASVAIEGVVEGVNRVAKGSMKDHDNLSGYVSDYIHQKLSDFVAECCVIRIPARTQRHKKELKITMLPFDEVDVFSKPEIDAEINEVIEKLPQSEKEREILKLRLEGFKDQQIADLVGLSHTSVYLIRREFQQRFLEKYHER